jgi:hypothetical protein
VVSYIIRLWIVAHCVIGSEMSEVKLFDHLNAINFVKEDTMVDADAEASYVPWVINRGVSFSADTIFYANEMNLHHHLPKKMQFDYYLHSLRKKKRYNKWSKRLENDDLDMVCEYFSFNRNKGLQALSVLTKDDLETIRTRMVKGGKYGETG